MRRFRKAEVAGSNPASGSTRATLAELEQLKSRFDRQSASRKLALLGDLARRTLASSSQIRRFHECLCFLRAYPDDARLLSAVGAVLDRFAARADLSRHRAQLADTGIAGTKLHFAFFEPTASWLAERFPEELTVDWPAFEHGEQLERLLELLVRWAETPALDEEEKTARGWIAALKGPRETDAVFLVRRFGALRVDAFVRQRIFEELDVPFVLAPGPGTPSRTLAVHRRSSRVFRTRPFRGDRPDLRREVAIPPRAIRAISPREARELVDLAREAMVTRSRDLDAFMFADPRDVRLVDCGGGLQFACFGVLPERRLLLEAVYGFLTLQNGVPIGYVLASAFLGSCEVAFNVFETFRGGDSAHVYVRALSMCQALFGADTFTIYPYQLGHENQEGLRSGAFWFYAKLGFVPRDRGALAILDRERARIRRDASHRSDLATLRALAAHNVYWTKRKARADVLGTFPLGKVGLAASAALAERFGSDRERGERICAEEAAATLGAPRWKSIPATQRQAFLRWGPLVAVLPGLGEWKKGEKAALVEVVRAKGGRRESDFVRRLDAHVRLRRALCELAGVRSSV